MPKVSIIVPVYNVEFYLTRCIDSLVNQTLKDIEIILVDDGSTDESGKLCDRYAEKDNRIKVIHKINGGLSDARNAGLDKCTGNYIGFVDGDDYIDVNMFEILYRTSIRYKTDISVGSLTSVINNKIVKDIDSFKLYKNVEEYITDAFLGRISVSVCNKLYRRQIFENLRFKVGKTSEDAYIFLTSVLGMKNFALDGRAKYYYVHRENSITTARYNEKIYDVIEAYRLNLNIIKSMYPKIVDVAEYKLLWSYRVTLDRILLFSDYSRYQDKVVQLQNLIRSNLYRALNNKYMKRSEKIAFILIASNICIYLKMKKIFGKRY